MWDDFDGSPVASLPTKFRMPDIDRYTGIGCPHIHLRLYSIVMRTHGLDESQMIMLFTMPLSGATQRWFASLDVFHNRTYDDFAQEFLRQFAFNTVVDISRSELETLRQMSNELVTLSISHWREKYRSLIPPQAYDQTYLYFALSQPCYAAQVMDRPPVAYSKPRASRTFVTFAPRPQRQFSQLGIPFSQAFRKFVDSPRHNIDRCTTLRHAMHDLIDRGSVNLGQPSVMANPLLTHSTHAVPLPTGDVHFIDLDEDDFIHMMITRSGKVSKPPLVEVGPFEGTGSRDVVIREDDEIMRQSTLPLYITVGCSGHRVPFILLDNGFALNVSPLAITMALGFGPSNFESSTQFVKAYDSTRREDLGIMTLELQIGTIVFSIVFQVLRIPTSFNPLLGRPWIHRAGAIPSSFHQKVKFIHEDKVITIQSSGDIPSSSEPVLEINHSENDLFFTSFTFDEV
ncbi:hypothetical protein CK203_028395 [Vitis vinifera]|uniref:Retrotransposon gag domain-containing protein n=1 Tax=Vitis vinifera TaxID=29760 RepID=A0A438J017_VITVI|nr:hypothetical protein CK203_028395 [Vitis vinifera]